MGVEKYTHYLFREGYMRKIGITGQNGRVGSELVRRGCVPLNVDITDIPDLKSAKLDDCDVIINCAAVTRVDACQHPPHIQSETYKRAVEVNTRGVEYLRKAFSGRLIHISTDYVFKCDKGPYKEDDKRDPVNDYGYTKFGGEIVLETFPWEVETVVVRTTGLFGSGSDFASYVIQSLQSGEIVIASKQLRGNHTYIPHLCDALLDLANRPYIEEFSYLHVASSDVMSRYDFAVMLANAFGLPVDNVKPCLNKEIAGWVAPRPTKGGLKVDKAKKMGSPLRSTLDGILAYKEMIR